MASNASGYPEALCLLGKIFPKPHFRMTSHAAARTLRGAYNQHLEKHYLHFLIYYFIGTSALSKLLLQICTLSSETIHIFNKITLYIIFFHVWAYNVDKVHIYSNQSIYEYVRDNFSVQTYLCRNYL